MSEDVVEELIESPWEAGEILAKLTDAERAEVRAQLLEHAADDGDSMDSGVPSCLAHFPDAEVLAALQAIIAGDADLDVIEEAVESIGTLARTLPAANEVLRALVTHEEDGIARRAIEGLSGSPDAILPLLLPLVDAIAARGDDLLMKAIVDQLVGAGPKHPEVIAALGRHWDFAIKHDGTLMAANAIFDALIDHAPRSAEAQAAFAAAVSHEHEYAQVQGHAALALTGPDITEHVRALNKMKGLQPSSSSLRKKALDKLKKLRKPELEALAAGGDRTAKSLLK